eukprot:SAG31_NODE_3269_length_4478_cov_2.680521_8_plen_35_part_01
MQWVSAHHGPGPEERDIFDHHLRAVCEAEAAGVPE